MGLSVKRREQIMARHITTRTSPKGQDYLGTCRMCGANNLTIEQTNAECPGGRGVTVDDALAEALTGKTKKVH
jgi:hypothetical protein